MAAAEAGAINFASSSSPPSSPKQDRLHHHRRHVDLRGRLPQRGLPHAVRGGILVLLVVFVFLQNWRATLIPMLAVPVSLIGTMAGLWLFGFSLNTLTLFAMTLFFIGIVVDDAIVVLENVERLMRTEGLGPYEAAQKAMKEVSGALVAIVLVLASVDPRRLPRRHRRRALPPVCRDGHPVRRALGLRRPDAHAGALRDPSQGKEARRAQEQVLPGLRPRTRVLHAQVPQARQGGAAPPRDHRRPARRRDGRLLADARAHADLLHSARGPGHRAHLGPAPRRRGLPPHRGRLDRNPRAPQKNDAVQSVVTMVGYDTMSGDVRRQCIDLHPEAQALGRPQGDRRGDPEGPPEVRRLPPRHQGRGSRCPAAIKGLGSTNGFSGYILSHGNDNPLVLQNVAENFLDALQDRPELTGRAVTRRPTRPSSSSTLTRPRRLRSAWTSTTSTTISHLMGSKYVNDFTRNGNNYRVVVQAAPQFRSTPEDIGSGYVRSSSGEMVPISALVRTERTSGAAALALMNGYLAAQFSGAAAQGVSSGDAIRIVEETAREVLPEGLHDRMGRSGLPRKAHRRLVRHGLRLRHPDDVPHPRRPLRALVAADRRRAGRPVRLPRRHDRHLAARHAQRHLLPDRSTRAHRPHGQERHSDRGVRGPEDGGGNGSFDAALAGRGSSLLPDFLMTSFAFVLGVVPLIIATGAGAGARHSMGYGRLRRNARRHLHLDHLRAGVLHLVREEVVEEALIRNGSTQMAAPYGAADFSLQFCSGSTERQPSSILSETPSPAFSKNCRRSTAVSFAFSSPLTSRIGRPSCIMMRRLP